MSLIRPTTVEEFLHPISGHVAPLFAFIGQEAYVGGTAVIVAPRIAVTANHVLRAITEHFGCSLSSQNIEMDLYVAQFSSGAFWYVSNASAWVGADIAVLSLRPRNDVARHQVAARLAMTVDPPPVGSMVTALGYPNTKFIIPQSDPDLVEMHFSITPTVSEGKVLQVHPSFRDSANLRFPCFSVDAEFDAGMSGGAVFNEHRELCGLVCSGGRGELRNYSHAASIWPMTIIPVKVPEDAPSYEGVLGGETYKLLELARLGYVALNGHERIEFFKHDNGSDGVRRHHALQTNE
jgi:hypothetical protein